jgi:ankyrin repeat protein
VEERNEDGVKACLEDGADPNATNALGFTPLMWACEYSTYEVVKMLIAAGGEVNRLTEKKRTPLSFAITGNNIPVVKLLIESKADLSQRIMEEEFTPLHYAARQGFKDLCQIFIRSGVDTKATDKSGKTAQELAIDNQYTLTAKAIEAMENLQLPISRSTGVPR